MNKYSEEEVLKFLDYVGSKGLMNESTARARKIAVQKFLGILEPSEKTDLRNINRDELFTRFMHKFAREFRPGSLQTYKQRCFSALDDFVSYVDNPAGYKANAAPRAMRQASRSGEPDRQAEAAVRRDTHSAVSAPPGLLQYPIPLPSGSVAQLYLPSPMNRADAERLALVVPALVNALAVDK